MTILIWGVMWLTNLLLFKSLEAALRGNSGRIGVNPGLCRFATGPDAG